MASDIFVLQPGRLTLAELRRLEREGATLALAPECRDAIARARDLIAAVAEAGTPAYGVNTGLGTLSKRAIAAADLEEMQRAACCSPTPPAPGRCCPTRWSGA